VTGVQTCALPIYPSLRALDDYLQAQNALQPGAEGEQLESRLAQDLVHRQVSQSAYYLCGECGFRARQFFWQCPACARWESISPERSQHE
jgi:lipopolysaccharide biosynthesis regulator YciM